MRPVRTLIVFVKAPRLGAVKRRLGAAIGTFAALRFYGRLTATLLKRVGRDRRFATVLAVTPDQFVRNARFWPPSLRREGQGPGDLGARMGRALARGAGNGPAVLVGSDIPDLRASHVWQAFRALGNHDFVFGPATDGGFWLIGARKPPPRRVLRNVRWSSRNALADTLANIGPGRRIAVLGSLSDVDDGESYARWVRSRAGDAQ
jgi:rSAM/selenodomain-associated transferase 1